MKIDKYMPFATGVVVGGVIGTAVIHGLTRKPDLPPSKPDTTEFMKVRNYKQEIAKKAPDKFKKLVGDLKEGRHVDWHQAVEEMRDSIKSLKILTK